MARWLQGTVGAAIFVGSRDRSSITKLHSRLSGPHVASPRGGRLGHDSTTSRFVSTPETHHGRRLRTITAVQTRQPNSDARVLRAANAANPRDSPAEPASAADRSTTHISNHGARAPQTKVCTLILNARPGPAASTCRHGAGAATAPLTTADRVGGGVTHVVQLVRSRGAGLHRAGSGEKQLAERFDGTVTGFGKRGGIAGEHGPGGHLRVDPIGFPAPAAPMPIGLIHLDDVQASSARRWRHSPAPHEPVPSTPTTLCSTTMTSATRMCR